MSNKRDTIADPNVAAAIAALADAVERLMEFVFVCGTESEIVEKLRTVREQLRSEVESDEM